MTVPRETDTDVQTVSDPVSTFCLTKDEVAEQLGVSVKTVERMVQRGDLQQAPLRGRGRPALYHPADVARILQERRLAAATGFVVPGQTPATNGNGHEAGLARVGPMSAGPSTDDLWRPLVALISQAVQTVQTRPPTVSELPDHAYLTPREVAAELRLSVARTRQLIKAGEAAGHFTTERGLRIQRRVLGRL